MRMVQPEMLDLARSLQATDWQIFTKVRLPNALPHFFGGLKIAITLAVIGAIIGEFIGGNHGLGYLIVVSNYEVNTPLMFSALIVLSLMGLILYGVIVLLERWFIPWGIEEDEQPPGFGM
jgi:NitT/TauT family transport system permease protein